MQYTIRKAEPKDANALSQLFHEFIGTDSDISAMERQIEEISQNPNYYIAVACDGDQVIATAMAIVCVDLVGNCNPFMVVENVVVSPQYRGHGAGKLLMQAIEEFGLEKKCNYIILVSGMHREPAHLFYESIGYSSEQRGFKKRLMKQT